jgi:hypothetical protein
VLVPSVNGYRTHPSTVMKSPICPRTFAYNIWRVRDVCCALADVEK